MAQLHREQRISRWIETHNRSFTLFRAAVLVFGLSTLILYISSISGYYENLRTTCIISGCGDFAPAPPVTTAELAMYGLTPDSYAVLFVLIDCALTFLFFLAAFLLIGKSPREPLGLLGAFVMITFGASFPSLAYIAAAGNAFMEAWITVIGMLGWISLLLFFFLFPDGRFVPRWTSLVFVLFAGGYLIREILWDTSDWLPLYKIVWHIVLVAVLLYSQIYRFRKVSGVEQRQQTKWVVFGLSVGMAGFIGVSFFFDPAVNGGGALTYVWLNAILHLFLLAIPTSLTLAVLRYRLWDIDPLVKRTFVYIGMSVCVVAVYTASVLYLSQVFRTGNTFIVSLIATTVVAVMFAPLKERLQRIVNRLMKGRHDDPYAVLVELGNQLVRPLESTDTLNAVVRTIKDELLLPYAAISVGRNGQETLLSAAGEPTAELTSFPVIHSGEQFGTLVVANRSPGESFSPEDTEFLKVLLHQAGPIVHNVHITLGMKLLAHDLQESREKLVLAREEERRQIRRNLHDDLAPRLAALALNAAAAEKYVVNAPDTAIEMLSDLRKAIRSTVDDIRTLVHDLRPPTLDELGLTGAIQERISELAKAARHDSGQEESLQIRLQSPDSLPSLPAAVEVAAFRIITESLVNVVRHAKATVCTIRLDLSAAGQLIVEISDNGSGLHSHPQAAPNGKGGIGLSSIRERAAELGGQCSIERLEQGGTCVRAVLPL